MPPKAALTNSVNNNGSVAMMRDVRELAAALRRASTRDEIDAILRSVDSTTAIVARLRSPAAATCYFTDRVRP
jgi:hypothetical protein